MAIQMNDVPGYEPAPAHYREPRIEMDVGGEGSRFAGDPSQLMGFMGNIRDLWNSSEASKKEETQDQDITKVDREDFRKSLQAQAGGDYRKINLYDETTRLYQSRLNGLRSHVFQGRIPKTASPEQQSYFAAQAQKLWQVCALEAKADRNYMMEQEMFGMDELDRRITEAQKTTKIAQDQRKRGIDLRKTYTGESIKEYQKTGDLSVLKKEREPAKQMTPDQAARLWLKIDEDMEDWVGPFEKDDAGQTTLNGKPVTDQQITLARQAEMERRYNAAISSTHRLPDVTGGPPPGRTGGAGKVESIFPEKKETKDIVQGKIFEYTTGDGQTKWTDEKGKIYDQDPRIDVKKETPAPASKEEIKNQAKTIKAVAEKKNKTLGDIIVGAVDETYEQKREKINNYLNAKAGNIANPRLYDPDMVKEIQAALKLARIPANAFNNWLKSIWFTLDDGTDKAIQAILNLPVPGTEKK